MTTHLTIDFIADISCPWCALGWASLRQALDHLQPDIEADVRLQPFELNPSLEPGGCDVVEYLHQRHGTTAEQLAEMQQTLRVRGEELGFAFPPESSQRLYNTFNAHRLLCWTGAEHPERQAALATALFSACHQSGLAMDADDVLFACVEAVYLDREQAMDVLASGAYADEVREQEAAYAKAGIRSVPTMIIDGRLVLSGARPPQALELALRQLVTETTGA